MEVNGLNLPRAFVAFVESIRDKPLRHHWQLIQPVDAYGHPWEADLDVYFEEAVISRETAMLPRKYGLPPEGVPPGIEETLALWAKQPGYIPDIDDFTHIVCFGRTASGGAFCFDFRESLQEPSIIFWHYGYWRRVAPSFESFAALIEPFGDYEIEGPGPEKVAEKPSGKDALLELFQPHEQDEWRQKLREAERRRFNEEVKKVRESEPHD